MWISKYFVYFVIYSCMGWLYESVFCTIKNGYWQNRGFLYGPVCPIYGVGAALITYIDDVILAKGEQEFLWWQIFLVAFLGSVVLEYATSYVLEKLFHAYWWDYSTIPFNIHGRVCLPASVGFGVAGLVVIYGVAPLVRRMTGWISPMWMELVSLLFMAVVSVDATLTVSALTHFERNVIAMEHALNQHMEQFVSSIQEKTQAAGAVLFSDERARFSSENMNRTVQEMGKAYRSALKRVEGFRSSGKEKERRAYSRQVVLESVKKYIGTGRRSG